jgi:hypothetical protein
MSEPKKEKSIKELIPLELQKELANTPETSTELAQNELKKKKLPSMIEKAVARLKKLEIHYNGGKDPINGLPYPGYKNVDPNDPEDYHRIQEKAEFERLIQKQKAIIRKLMVEYQLQLNEN